MTGLSRRALTRVVLTAASAAALLALPAVAQDTDPVRIGWAIALSGSNATGASISTLPNYRLWVEEVNAEGGLEMPDGIRRPIEIIEYDDRSSNEDLVRAIERLATQDEVDLILPPWGTGGNIAIALLLDEPSLGLAPIVVGEVFAALARVRASGLTLILVEQNVRASLRLADRGYLLEAGRVVGEGTARELEGSDPGRQAFLGGAARKNSEGILS